MLQQFMAEVRKGFKKFGPTEHRRVYRMLQLVGTVRGDPNGVKLE